MLLFSSTSSKAEKGEGGKEGEGEREGEREGEEEDLSGWKTHKLKFVGAKNLFETAEDDMYSGTLHTERERQRQRQSDSETETGRGDSRVLERKDIRSFRFFSVRSESAR
jgi:hypothetical protein